MALKSGALKAAGPQSKGLLESGTIQFTVNGVQQTVGSGYDLTMTLNEYLRVVLNLTGTKKTCGEGGCGSCIVTGSHFDYTKQSISTVSVNSCLFPLYACDEWSFTTIEGVGSSSAGYHEIQKRLASTNGSQCGFCSPGMVMNMYSLLAETAKPDQKTIEDAFDGNICRCTGYRAILDAMKSFSVDREPIEIEDLHHLECLKVHNKKRNCSKTHAPCQQLRTHMIKDDAEWYTPQTMDEFFQVLTDNKCKVYKIVAGNTSLGVFKNDGPYQVFINIQKLQDLYQSVISVSELVVGSHVNLSTLIHSFEAATGTDQFEYLGELAAHLKKVANTSVRNVATWAGNLAMKYYHLDFPSDVFICLETAGATITLVGPEKDSPSIQVSASQLLSSVLQGRLIYSASFPPYDEARTFIKTFKVMLRAENCHAYVNAGFRVTIDPFSNVVQANPPPSIVFGGISQDFIHATQTESYLVGKPLNDPKTLAAALQTLFNEVNPDSSPVLSSPEYRRNLATALFYKYVLFVCKSSADQRFRSASDTLIDLRAVSQGTQSYPTTQSLYPLTQPVPKLNALAQAAGQANYVYDSCVSTAQLEGTYFLAEVGNCRIDSIDTSDALLMPGVAKIFLAKDIPGVNNLTPPPLAPEQLFADDYINYAGQALGLVVADTFEHALAATKKIKITYKEQKPPILTIDDAIKAQSFYPKPGDDFVYGDAEQALATAPFVVTGQCSLNTQHHFYMENQVTVCTPTEDGLTVESSTQWLDWVQKGIAQVLGMQNNRINVSTKQLGGGYGGKMTRANMIACGAALAANALNKPVKVTLTLNSCMEMVGKRFPWQADYAVGFDGGGLLLGIKMNWYLDPGAAPSDKSHGAYKFADNVYKCANWHIVPNLVKTNTPANTSCRSPGTFPAIAIMEHIIEHVAKALDKDPLVVKTVNLYQKNDVTPYGQPLPYFNVGDIISQLIHSSDYSDRVNQINTFNQQNRWKKRGISLQPLKWGAQWGGAYNCYLTIYYFGGSISISHGGVEVGQGIHTKIAQVCAYELGVDLDLVTVKSTNNLVSPNQGPTGGSVTSELISMAAIECCKIINDRLDPIRKLMPSGYTWQDLIIKAFSSGVDLTAHYEALPKSSTPLAYDVYGAAVSEVIVDILTGEVQILRVDMLYDCGQSMNGLIDVTQAEGGFVMGIGFWLTEQFIYDPDSGKCLTNGTWEYKPPSTKDIPADFRITFMNNNPNPLGVLGSKCVGEPPLCLSVSVKFAVEKAIQAALQEARSFDYFHLPAPATPERINAMCKVDISQMTFS